MGIAAIGLWLLTAVAGLLMMGTWIADDGVRRGIGRRGRHRRFPRKAVYGHIFFAVLGLAAWFAFLLLGTGMLAWAAVALLAVVAVLGLAMFPRWLPSSHRRIQASRQGADAPRFAGSHRAQTKQSRTPLVATIAHGVLAVGTIGVALTVAVGHGTSADPLRPAPNGGPAGPAEQTSSPIPVIAVQLPTRHADSTAADADDAPDPTRDDDALDPARDDDAMTAPPPVADTGDSTETPPGPAPADDFSPTAVPNPDDPRPASACVLLCGLLEPRLVTPRRARSPRCAPAARSRPG